MIRSARTVVFGLIKSSIKEKSEHNVRNLYKIADFS